MTDSPYDIAVIGLGAMGSAAAYACARRGLRVIGFEQFKPGGHRRGSTHGESRVYRQAYFEGEAYVPMLLRAETLWRELEAHSGETLFHQCGGLFMGLPDSALVRGSLASCVAHGLRHELLDADTIQSRYPRFNPPDDFVGLLEPAAGVLFPERSIGVLQDVAVDHHAELHFHTEVDRIEAHDAEVTVQAGELTVTARQAIVTAGAWASHLLPELAPLLQVKRVLMHWFESDAPEDDPVHAWEFPDGRFLYGPPAIDGCLKLAFHNRQLSDTHPDRVDRKVQAEEVAFMEATARPVLPALGAHANSKTCLYTMTPDEHCIIDQRDRLTFAAGFSGHGFKFTPAIGEILADLATGMEPGFDLSMFRLSRFS